MSGCFGFVAIWVTHPLCPRRVPFSWSVSLILSFNITLLNARCLRIRSSDPRRLQRRRERPGRTQETLGNGNVSSRVATRDGEWGKQHTTSRKKLFPVANQKFVTREISEKLLVSKLLFNFITWFPTRATRSNEKSIASRNNISIITLHLQFLFVNFVRKFFLF